MLGVSWLKCLTEIVIYTNIQTYGHKTFPCVPVRHGNRS